MALNKKFYFKKKQLKFKKIKTYTTESSLIYIKKLLK